MIMASPTSILIEELIESNRLMRESIQNLTDKL